MGWGLNVFIAIVTLFVAVTTTLYSNAELHLPASFVPRTTVAAPEASSPSNWIEEQQIRVYDKRVILNIENATWATFTNTNSMDPLLDEHSHALEILPQDPNAIQVGDIISYTTKKGVLIHRVVEKGIDAAGVYYVVKGDNNEHTDPFKVRYPDIVGVVVAVIY